MTHPLSLRADPLRSDLTVRTWSVRAETLDVEERSVEAILSTETPTAVFDFSRREVIDEVLIARGAEFAPQVVLLDDHMRFGNDSVLGSVRGIRVEGETVVGRLVFAEGDERAERIWNKVRQGHLTDVSIGYRALEYVDVPANTRQTVAGRSFEAGPRTLRVTTRYTIREGSVTPIGADHGAKIRAEAGLPPQLETPMNLRQYLESIGLAANSTDEQARAFHAGLTGEQRRRADELATRSESTPSGSQSGNPPSTPANAPAPPTDGQRSAPPATPPATPPTDGQRRETVPPAEDPAAVAARRAIEAERDRVRTLRAHATQHHVPASLLERAEDRGWSLDEFRERADDLSAIRGEPGDNDPVIDWNGGFAVRGFDRVASANALAAGLMHRTGLSESVIGAEAAAEFHGPTRTRLTEQDAERGDRFATDSFVDLCRHALRVDGRQVPHNRDEMIRAAVSTPALSFAFSTSVHARMLASYMEEEDTSDWAASEDVANFQTQDRGALGKTAGLEKLGRGGTANHASITDNVESYKIARYAKQFVIDEQDMLDDNLGLIQEMPTEMGEAARRLRPDLVYAILLANPAMRDTIALFHTDHANTASDALAIDKLEAAVTAMMQQTEDGVRLNTRPQYLIVNPTLEWTARTILGSAQVVIAGDTDTVRGNRNVIADVGLQLRVEKRLDATGVEDPNSGTTYTGSTTRWHLAATRRTILVGYRSGTGRRPQMRRFTLDRGQYGLGWDINLDIGAKALDWRTQYRGNS